MNEVGGMITFLRQWRTMNLIEVRLQSPRRPRKDYTKRHLASNVKFLGLSQQLRLRDITTNVKVLVYLQNGD